MQRFRCSPWSRKTNLKIQELRNSLEKQKDQELTLLRQQTEKALIYLDAYYRQNHQQLSEELFHRLLEC